VPGGEEEVRAAPGGALLERPFGGMVFDGPRGGGVERGFSVPFKVSVPGCFFLNSRQQEGHRHSARTDPSGAFERVRRQPNWALMSV
jgi:hypothetical protein